MNSTVKEGMFQGNEEGKEEEPPLGKYKET